MKLRIKGSSLRFRVSRSDLASLLAHGEIEETVIFAPDDEAHFTYALQHGETTRKIAVHYGSQRVTVMLPTRTVVDWAKNEVGIYDQVDNGHGSLNLIIEKDFACLDGSEAENADTFAHPAAELGDKLVC